MEQKPLTTKEFVEKYGLAAKKALGQNFLLDGNITDKIMRLSLKAQGLESLKGERAIEVGPGPGGLTQAVLRQNPDRLTAIETDDRCLQILEEIRACYPALEIVSGDALQYDWGVEDGSAHIVSNLPYHISVPLLTGWLKDIKRYKSLTLMFQKEVADRIMAEPDSKEYGRLSVLAQLQAKVVRLFDLPPTCFVPAPKIWSSVLLFLPRENAVSHTVLEKVEDVTALAFGQRRKMIRQSLKSLPDSLGLLEDLGIEPTLRAENLNVLQYLDIAKRLI